MKAKNRCFLKAILFALILNVLLSGVMILYAETLINDVWPLLLSVIIFTVAAVLYAPIKGDEVPKPIVYNLVSLMPYIACEFLTLFILIVYLPALK